MNENCESLKYKYVLFDLDGTLTDPKEGICKSAQYALHKLGIEEPNLDNLEPFIGPTLKYSFKELYSLDDKQCNKAIDYYRERFSVVGLYENEIYPGIEKLLAGLKEAGAMVALASGKPTVFAEKILEHFGIKKYFDVIIGSELDGSRSEKDEVVEEALLSLYYGEKRKGASLDKCEDKKKTTVMVGDRKYDILSAEKYGIDSLAVAYGYAPRGELKKAGANHIVKTTEELSEYLLSERVKSKKDSQVKNGKDIAKPVFVKPMKNASAFILKKDEVPAGSFMRAVYVLTPFALYYLVKSAASVIGMILWNKMAGNPLADVAAGSEWDEVGIISIISTLIGALVLILVYRRRDYLGLKPHPTLPIIAVSSMLMALGVNLLIGYVMTEFPQLANPAGTVSSMKELSPLVGTLLHCICVPLAEELVFRYLIFGRARRFLGTGVAVVCSALFFALYHMNLMQGIYAFIMGIMLALVYEWTETFLAPLVFHIFANTSIYYSPYLSENIQKMVLSTWFCILSIGVGFALLLAVGHISKLRKEKK